MERVNEESSSVRTFERDQIYDFVDVTKSCSRFAKARLSEKEGMVASPHGSVKDVVAAGLDGCIVDRT